MTGELGTLVMKQTWKPAKVHNRGPTVRFANLQQIIVTDMISDNNGISIGIGTFLGLVVGITLAQHAN